MAQGSSRTLAGRARSVVGRALGRTSTAPEPAPEPTAAVVKAPAKKAPAKKAPAKKATAKKATAKKATAKKATAKKAPAKQAAATSTGATRTTATKKTPTKRPARRPAATNPAPSTRSTTTSSEKTTATKKASAAPTQSTPAEASTNTDADTDTAPKRARKGSAAALVVLPSESPWTKEELGRVKARLREDVDRLVPELDVADHQLHDLMVDAGDGAGADQADVGSSSFERDQGLTIANNAREMLEQSQHALERIADGSYGVCESCGEAIGKKRLMAFPRATLCMTCKQREERH